MSPRPNYKGLRNKKGVAKFNKFGTHMIYPDILL